MAVAHLRTPDPSALPSALQNSIGESDWSVESTVAEVGAPLRVQKPALALTGAVSWRVGGWAGQPMRVL